MARAQATSTFDTQSNLNARASQDSLSSDQQTRLAGIFSISLELLLDFVMDGLSGAASVIAVVDITMKLGLALKDYYEGVRDAREDIQKL